MLTMPNYRGAYETASERIKRDPSLLPVRETLQNRSGTYDEAHFIAFAPASHVIDFVNDLQEGKPSGFGEA